MLERMRRGYTRQAYDDLVDRVRELVPGVSLSTDIISGAHAATLSASGPLPCGWSVHMSIRAEVETSIHL